MNFIIEKDMLNIAQAPLVKSQFIIAHEAGNPNNTGEDSLANEISYMKRNWQHAFVSHWVGGGGRIVQIARTGYTQWGAGPKANPYAFAQVELARTRVGSTFQKDYAAYVWLLRQLAAEAGIPFILNSDQPTGIKTHSWISRNIGGTDHVDPDAYLARWGISMKEFKTDIEAPINDSSKPRYLLHLVVRGDTLWSLSQKNKTTVAALKKLNGLTSDLIITGQILKLRQI
ncbi:LysM peptidoglycan-binding domain-containing protein [Jeotgalibaca caeni]|uniref:LysM peptidoglycan-binding domain-containing protein n=1 Tax=Jeotgalibaca caeni TaxID=3028623 RepID=UPI00237EA036|nr:LysM peptidoglycan-binding domain-containing protein [Jeotgalibaca caeni]MDE1548177.1 LysM peptidoglycan-binding domain-containing protein [Jeotgalibaca caeni]